MGYYLIDENAYNWLQQYYSTLADFFSPLPQHNGVYYAPADSEGLSDDFFIENDIYFKATDFTMSTISSVTFP